MHGSMGAWENSSIYVSKYRGIEVNTSDNVIPEITTCRDYPESSWMVWCLMPVLSKHSASKGLRFEMDSGSTLRFARNDERLKPGTRNPELERSE